MLNISESDYTFVKQALRDRTEKLINLLCPEIDMFAEKDDSKFDIKKLEIKLQDWAKPEAPKDLSPEAPYGYKLDGTPRARPGRPAKKSKAKRK